MNISRQRRRLLINTRYQLRHMAVILSVNLLLMLLISVLISWFYLLFFKGNLTCDHNRLFPLYLAVLALAAVAFLALWSLYRSRSVAGMMRKIEQVLADAAAGRVPGQPLGFRKEDYFAPLAGPLNDCLSRMRRQDQQRIDAVGALRELHKDLAEQTLQNRVETIIVGLERPQQSENN